MKSSTSQPSPTSTSPPSPVLSSLQGGRGAATGAASASREEEADDKEEEDEEDEEAEEKEEEDEEEEASGRAAIETVAVPTGAGSPRCSTGGSTGDARGRQGATPIKAKITSLLAEKLDVILFAAWVVAVIIWREMVSLNDIVSVCVCVCVCVCV